MSKVKEYKEPRFYAKDKLQEARYFLDQMRRSYVDRTEFIYNMNAFLASGRSVTYVLQNEFSGIREFNSWYSKKQKIMREDRLMRFFKENRDVAIHEQGIPKHIASVKTAYVIPTEKETRVGYSDSKSSRDHRDSSSILVMPSFDEKGMRSGIRLIKPAYSVVTSWKFEKAPEGYDGADILALCQTYFMKLEELVSEAERKIREVLLNGSKSSE